MLFLHSLESVFTIIIMFMTGYFLTRAGWLNDQISDTFSKIILFVSLPCYMVYNLTSTFSRSLLESLAVNLIVPFLTIGLSYVIGIIVSNIMKIKKNRKGIFRSIFFSSNTIFIGLPINLALFGEKSVPYVLLYYIANTTFFWTLGAYEISKDGISEEKVKFFSKATLKQIFSPTLIGFMIGIVLILLNIKLPAFILNSCKYFGDLTTPLAMLFIGIVLFSVKIKSLKIDLDTVVLTLARFIICPVIVILLTHIFKTPPLMAKVFVIQSAMPAMTCTSIVAKGYGADYEYATVVTVVTTILSMAVIPIYMVLMG